MQPLINTTRPKAIKEALLKTLRIYETIFQELTSITTNGAAAKTGTKSGLIALLKKDNTDIINIHGTIHQET